MAKRKSTFERLSSGGMNRKQRRDLARRLAGQDPRLTIVHSNAGGIDVGNESHYVAVPPDRDENPVREFGCWTQALHEMAEWLKSCRIETVAVQATGVYWIALYDVLEQHGIRVVLVNAQHTKNVPGRKTDVQECQWLMNEDEFTTSQRDQRYQRPQRAGNHQRHCSGRAGPSSVGGSRRLPGQGKPRRSGAESGRKLADRRIVRTAASRRQLPLRASADAGMR